jgi:hypothetical protein
MWPGLNQVTNFKTVVSVGSEKVISVIQRVKLACQIIPPRISCFKELRLSKVSTASRVSLGLTRVSLG